MSNISVSVIVPVYNVEKYLERCLDKLINQTLKSIEIICINDGSKDNSREILAKYAQKDNRIIIIDQENAGLSAARNAGMEIAKGEYIGFVDSDDWVDLDFYEKLYNAAKENDCDIAVADFIRQHPKKQKKRLHFTEEKIYETTEDKYLICKTFREGCVWNKIYRTQMLKDINLKFVVGMYYEDRDFTARSLHFSKKLVTVPDTYYNYFVNPKSIVKLGGNKKQDEHYVLVRQQVLAFIKEQNINVPDGLYKAEIFNFKIFGKTLFSIKESTKSKYVFMFGKINIFKY
ncbi:MAG: glycosyltransferase [Cyanobacteria bacterium SIG26]|nr:glycosyltransferase [Cyanobacteria bacterium SIG26]